MSRNGCDGDRSVEGVRSGLKTMECRLIHRPRLYELGLGPVNSKEDLLERKKMYTVLGSTGYSHMVHRGYSCNPRRIGYSLAYEFKRVHHQKRKKVQEGKGKKREGVKGVHR
jgi:hypothetical protein